MQVSFHPEAERELSESIEYYEDLKRGLGLDFASEVYKSIGDAYAFPAAWSEIVPGIRRVLVRRFLFGYVVLASSVLLLEEFGESQKREFLNECVICKHNEASIGATTVILENRDSTITLKDAQV